jgi:hypothetical protein
MYYASISEAFGVDSLDAKPETAPKATTKVERTKFLEKVMGEDVQDTDSMDVEPVLTIIPEERKLSKFEVKKYVSEVYTKEGINAIWKLLDTRVQKQILGMCKNSVTNAQKFFDDIFTSPEKMLVILAGLFILIILLDVSQNKTDTASRPMMSEQLYYPQYYQGGNSGYYGGTYPILTR